MNSDLAEAIRLLSRTSEAELTSAFKRIEGSARWLTASACRPFLEEAGGGRRVLGAASEMKRLANR